MVNVKRVVLKIGFWKISPISEKITSKRDAPLFIFALYEAKKEKEKSQKSKIAPGASCSNHCTLDMRQNLKKTY